MESESVRLLRDRRAALWGELEELRAGIRPLEAELDQVERGIRAMEGAPLIAPTGQVSSRKAVAHHTRKANPKAATMTIKQMVIGALELLPTGATANEMLEFFARQWGRDEIMRTSLSPQLTRLKVDGKIELRGKVWHLATLPEFEWVHFVPIDENEAPNGEPPEPQKPASEGVQSPEPAWNNPSHPTGSTS